MCVHVCACVCVREEARAAAGVRPAWKSPAAAMVWEMPPRRRRGQFAQGLRLAEAAVPGAMEASRSWRRSLGPLEQQALAEPPSAVTCPLWPQLQGVERWSQQVSCLVRDCTGVRRRRLEDQIGEEVAGARGAAPRKVFPA